MDTVFDIFHPAVALAYFAGVLGLTMTGAQPALVGVSLVGALALSATLRGWGGTLRTLAWIVPLVLVVAVLNMLTSASGATELFRVGLRSFSMESLVFGLTMGAMLAAVMLWFADAGTVLTSDKIMGLLGGRLPTISLLITMTARLLPQFVRRGRAIEAAQSACTAAMGAEVAATAWAAEAGASKDASRRSRRAGKGGRRARPGLRLLTVLMGWSMEDSLETAAAMRARGWGCGAVRTTYQQRPFRRVDGVALAAIFALVATATLAEGALNGSFRFYPTLDGWGSPWLLAPFALLAGLPLIVTAKETLAWRS